MICSNCGYAKDKHVLLDNKLLCLQKEGVFTTQVERYECNITRTDAKGDRATIRTPVLAADTARLHNTIIRCIEEGYTDIIVTVVDRKLKEPKKVG